MKLSPILLRLTLRRCFELVALAVTPSQLIMPRLPIKFGAPLSLSSKGVLYERLVSVNLRVL
jgi:hypothetical protein